MPREPAAAFFGARLAGARLRAVVDLGFFSAAMVRAYVKNRGIGRMRKISKNDPGVAGFS